MNVKRYIHPRNKYKKPPNYKQLAIMYPEFRDVAVVDFTGKVRLDFQDKKSLRVLTETLLKHDFDLHVSIPSNNLNPAITLRMNYILWIEDLMRHSKLEMNKVMGIDIGTGAICIYALLLAKIYGCCVIGTEVNKESTDYAEKCIRRNNLQDLIKVNSDRIFKDAVDNEKAYDFSICNPPFFENNDNGKKITKAQPPRNAPTGNDSELKTEGGEIAFVTKMIDESIELGDRIKIYSTMIGRKADLFQLKKLIRSRNIENVTWTEFCQGYTTRWGLAWSFLPKSIVDLSTAPVIRKSGKSMVQILKKNYKTSITFPVENKFFCIDDLISFLRTTAKEINIKLQDIPIHEDNFDGWMCRMIAEERSWEHSRRKRRLTQREIALKRLKNGECTKTNAVEEISNTIPVTKEDDNNKEMNKNPLDESLSTICVRNDTSSPNEENSAKKVLENRVPLLVCKLYVQVESPECNEEEFLQENLFRIWMVFENGSGGLDALQSLRQYLINKLEVRENICNNPSKPVKKRRKRTRNSPGNSTSIEQSIR